MPNAVDLSSQDKNNKTMFGFRVKSWQNGFGSTSPGPPVGSPSYPESSPGSTSSPKTDVGEIDTRAPIKSVRAAVSLFGDVISPKEKPPAMSPKDRPLTKKTIQAEEQQLLEKETQHHMVFRELDHYKDKLRAIESAKAQASRELSRANRTLQELTNKLEALSESKQSAIHETEDAKRRSQQLVEELDMKTEHDAYKASAGQLIASKQELTSLRQDVDAALQAKLAAFQEQEGAHRATRANQARKARLSKEVEDLRETLGQVRAESIKAEEEHLRVSTEKEIYVLVQKSTMEEAKREIERLREANVGPAVEEKLEEANGAIAILREQLEDVRTSDLRSLEDAVSELDFNKRELEGIVEEKRSIWERVDSVRLELEDARRRRSESEGRAVELESRVEGMKKDLKSKKTELEMAKSGSAIWDEMRSNLEKLIAEAERGRDEAEGLNKEAMLLRKEAEVANIGAREADEKLEAALKEVEAAVAAEKLADEKIHESPRNDGIGAEANGGQGSLRRIRLSAEEFEAMNQKIEDCNNRANEKVATLMAQLETITASGNEASRKVEVMTRENEEMKSEIEEAVKRAEMSEDARKLVEVELEKWREGKGDDEAGEPSS